MGHDTAPAGKDAADASTDTPAEALPISDEAAEAVAGGAFWEFGEAMGKVHLAMMSGRNTDAILKLFEGSNSTAAIPASSLAAPVPVACPVQLSGSIGALASKE